MNLPDTDHLVSLLEGISDAFFAVNNQGEFTYLNQQAAQFFQRIGWPPKSEILGKNIWEEFPELVGSCFYQKCHQAIAEQEGLIFEEFYQSLNLWLEVRVYPSSAGLLVSSHDITLQKAQTEPQAEESNLIYRLLFENSEDGLMLTAPDGRILDANPAATRILGYSKEEIIARGRAGILDTTDPNLPEYLERRAKEGSATGELTIIAKDGTKIPVELTSRIFYVENGGVRTSLRFHDISKRKEAENIRRRYHLLSANTLDIILFIKPDGAILEANRAATLTYGYSLEELQALNIRDLRAPETIPLVTSQMQQANRGGIIFETRHRRRGGIIFPVEVSSHGIELDNEQMLLSVIRDISERKRIEKVMSESEERYRLLTEYSTDIIFKDAVNGTILYASPACRTVLGYEPAEMEGHSVFEFAHPEEREQIAKGVVKANPDLNLNTHIGQFRRKDGTYIWLETSNRLIRDPETGLPQYSVGTSRDITARKRAEEALALSEARFQAFMNNSPMAAWIADEAGKIVYISQPASRLINLMPEEVLGKTIFDLLPHEVAEQVVCRRLRSIETGQAVQEVQPYPKADGTLVYGLSYNFPLPGPFGQKLAGMVLVDITERIRIEEALRESEELLSITLRSIGDGVVVTDAEGNIVLFNQAAADLTGYATSEVIGLPANQVLQLLDSTADLQPVNPVAEVLDSKQVSDLSGNLLLLTRQGHKLNVTCTGMPLYDKEANRLGAVVTFLDVTEKMKLAEESLKARNLESLGVLAGGIAHNFNNILTAIMGNISLAKINLNESTMLNQYLEEAEKATIRTKELARQLLTFARGGSPNKETCKIETFLKDTASYLLQGSKLRVTFDLPDNLWSVLVDQTQLSQVIQHLLLNATEAMPEVGFLQVRALNVTLEAGQVPLLNRGDYVRITLQDHGTGIKPEDLPKIVDPYFTTKFMGKGMGLPICYSIMRKHEGQMVVESEWGKGTTVHLYLPAIIQPTNNRLGKGNLPQFGCGRILLMDDESMLRDLVKKLLQRIGYEVEGTATGEEALEAYSKAVADNRPFRAVIADLMVPNGMGGQELIQKLLSLDPKVKALVMSGYSDDPVIANYSDYGFCGAICKPFTLAALGQILKEIIQP
ncbi:MAG: PAS domain S-box protein [Chloroflexota bacterium]|nr:PAS domain S-box protein [Chloroflexota bacterium]